MPFQPLPDRGPDKIHLSDVGLLLIRIAPVAIFSYYQLGSQLSQAIEFIWDGREWDLVLQLDEKGFPAAAILAPVAIAIFTIALLGVLVGIFTRINAFLLTVLSGFILLTPVILSATLNPQATTLYLGFFAGLACGGGGRLSLDYALATRRERRRMHL
ncbi:MAG: DoxX family protein [Verrucomicrobiaceae bacterium]|nr:DoxX family protein [Verrucomicrobiaceae bacterium]